MKNYNDPIGNETHHLSICRTVTCYKLNTKFLTLKLQSSLPFDIYLWVIESRCHGDNT